MTHTYPPFCMNEQTKKDILKLIRQEVVPAIGCTEPIAVALAVAKASELLGEVPANIKVKLSANILKNAMGVGIPGTGMVGLPIAIALGALIGKSDYGLEVLKDLSPDGLEQGKKMIANKCIDIALKETKEKLYIEALVVKDGKEAKAVICRQHTHFVFLAKNEEILMDSLSTCDEEVSHEEEEDIRLSFGLVHQFATEMPLEDIRFIMKTAELNKKAAEASLRGAYGHTVNQTIGGKIGRKYMGDNAHSHMLVATSAACDARMDGALIPVMSNSGSGNQGIVATLPVLSFAEDVEASEEQLVRAMTMSHLTVIYIKQHLGRLSALCGCVVAAIGASCGITYLMGGTKEQISFAIKNMIGNITGMICDGAKPSCALKVASGVSTAMLSAMMAIEDKVVNSLEGIVDEDVDRSIFNLTSIGTVGMEATDRLVLDIMTKKASSSV